jgi:hypothetical protein
MKTAGCSILPSPTPPPADKNCHPTGTLPTNCQRRAGGPGAETGATRAIEKKNLMQNNMLKNFRQTGTEPA